MLRVRTSSRAMLAIYIAIHTYIVMSDSEDSTVTYTAISSLFGAAFQAPPSPDYVPDLRSQAPLSPEFIPEPVYPEFMPPEDEVLPAEDQPLPVAISPTADSPGYIPESDPEEDPEEDPVDYPADGGDDDDDDESFDDDEDDDDDVEEDEDEEEEHPTLVDFIPPPVHRVTARISIRTRTPVSLPSDTEVSRLLTIPTLPPSPLSPLSSPLPSILSPPLLVSSPPLPASPTYSLGYQAAMIRLRAKIPSTSHPLPLSTPPSGTPPLLPIPAPTSSPSLLLPSIENEADRLEVCLPPQKRLCIALGLRYEVEESSSAPAARPTGGFRADYGFVATVDREIRRDPERDVGYGIIDTWYEMLEDMPRAPATDTDEIYMRLGEAQDERLLMGGRLNLLQRDRRAHAHTTLLMEREARLSREASGRSMDASDLSPSKVMALRTQTQVTALQGQLGTASGPAQPEIPEEAGHKMTPKRTTRANPADTTATTFVTNAQLKAMIDQGVTYTLVARDADRNTNGDDSHNSEIDGTKGVVKLIQWFEKMETVFSISNCSVENKIKFSTCTLLADLKNKMTHKYCPRVEIKKLEAELWNLKVKGTDVIGYNQHFQELALLCVRMFPEESDKIERYNKRKQDDNQQQQQPNKRQNTGRAYTAGSGEKKPYGDLNPYALNETITMMVHVLPDATSQKPTYYECGAQGHFKRDCPKLKNNNRGNQAGNGNAPAKVYAVGHAGTNPDSNVVTGMFLLNNRNASILFDTDADRSFMSTAFSSQFDITPSTLDHYYEVELVDGRIIGTKPSSFVPRKSLLIVHGDGSNRGNKTRLNIISCTKTQKYLLKGCQVFLAYVTTKKAEDKSEEKQLEHVPIIRDFPDIIPEDFLGLLLTRQVKFQIDLIPGAAPVA
ncbi:putative reverse transcriptase domain-containing protein [Tanacetum coccineum]